MKLFSLIMALFMCSLTFAKPNTKKQDSPAVIGKIIKLKHEKEGTNYFITYTRDGKDLAFPISPTSKVRDLHKFAGDTVKVFGRTSFKKSDRKELAYIMYFEVESLNRLSLKDLEYKHDISKQDEVSRYLKKQSTEPYDGNGLRINDTVANTTIFVGGAILAAEVLSSLLKK
jgi:hypothetical protein